MKYCSEVMTDVSKVVIAKANRVTADVLPVNPRISNGLVVGRPSPNERMKCEEIAGMKYCSVSDGAVMGDATESKAFLGQTTYIVESGSLPYDTNNFKVPAPDASGTVEAEICVVPSDTSTAQSFTCGAKRMATPGTMKFSLYGLNMAASISSEYSHFIYRAKLCFNNLAVDEQSQAVWKLNGLMRGQGVIDAGVKLSSLEVTQSDGMSIAWDFPAKYVFGSTSNCACKEAPATTTATTTTEEDTTTTTDDGRRLNFLSSTTGTTTDGTTGTTTTGEECLSNKYKCTPTGTKDVYITAASIAGESDCPSASHNGGGVFLDYAFDLDDLREPELYFAYDPSVSPTATANTVDPANQTDTTNSTADATTTTTTTIPEHKEGAARRSAWLSAFAVGIAVGPVFMAAP